MLDEFEEIRKLEEETKKANKYVNPFFIVISGLPGSGKTSLAWSLSKYLKIVCLSNDYIRNKIYQNASLKDEYTKVEVEKFVKKIAFIRLEKLFSLKASFVYDMNVNNIDLLDNCLNYAKKNNYQLIKIKINSKDQDNIKRISKRKIDYNEKDNSVIGDNTFYSRAFKEEEYYQIKSRKYVDLGTGLFDYVIDNNSSKDKYLEQILKITEDIKLKMLTK